MPSFTDYIKNGLRINMQVAIDYTLSNGKIDDPSSFHYLDPDKDICNPYETAIRAVGQIIEPLSLGQNYAAYGFGGIPFG